MDVIINPYGPWIEAIISPSLECKSWIDIQIMYLIIPVPTDALTPIVDRP